MPDVRFRPRVPTPQSAHLDMVLDHLGPLEALLLRNPNELPDLPEPSQGLLQALDGLPSQHHARKPGGRLSLNRANGQDSSKPGSLKVAECWGVTQASMQAYAQTPEEAPAALQNLNKLVPKRPPAFHF